MLTFDLPTIWAFIIAFAIFAYVVMDGFDLGIGILFSWIPTGRERDTAMNTIAPVWDGNETWLVLGGGGLLAAFPLAYGLILSAIPAIVPIGISPSASARSRRPLRRVSPWAPCCRASPSKTASMPAAGSTGCSPSPCWSA